MTDEELRDALDGRAGYASPVPARPMCGPRARFRHWRRCRHTLGVLAQDVEDRGYAISPRRYEEFRREAERWADYLDGPRR